MLLPLTVALPLLILPLLPASSSKHKMARTKLSVPRRCPKQLVKIANRRVVDASEEGGGDAFISWPLKRILKKDKESVRAKFRLVKQVHKELRASSRRHGTYRTSYFDRSHRNAVAKFLAQAVDFLDEPAFDPEKYDRASKNIVESKIIPRMHWVATVITHSNPETEEDNLFELRDDIVEEMGKVLSVVGGCPKGRGDVSLILKSQREVKSFPVPCGWCKSCGGAPSKCICNDIYFPCPCCEENYMTWNNPCECYEERSDFW